MYLANCRGTVYSLKHTKLDVYEKDFWRFGMDEIQHDMRSYLNYIVQETGQKVHVIALSQGAAGIIAGLADPNAKLAKKLADKIEKFHCLAPVIYTVRIYEI